MPHTTKTPFSKKCMKITHVAFHRTHADWTAQIKLKTHDAILHKNTCNSLWERDGIQVERSGRDDSGERAFFGGGEEADQTDTFSHWGGRQIGARSPTTFEKLELALNDSHYQNAFFKEMYEDYSCRIPSNLRRLNCADQIKNTRCDFP